MNTAVDLSLVIPCFNETLVLEESVGEIRRVLDRSTLTYEFVFVDDCSTDNTVEILRNLAERIPNTKLLLHERNTGRGRAVADGVKAASGWAAGFIDIDLSTAALYIPEFVAQIQEGADMAMAHRVYKITPLIVHRWILSRGYHYLMKYMLGVPLKDTETGCKFFNREKILPVLDDIKDPHWFWDTEICARTYYKGYRIVEVPTLYLRRPETGTTVKILRDSFNYFCNLIKFRAEALHMRQEFEKRCGCNS